MPTSFSPFAGLDTVSGRLSRFLRSASFRLAAFYAGVFVTSAGVLFAVIYWIATDALHQLAAKSVEQEITALAEDYSSGGRGQLVKAIDFRLAGNVRNDLFYALTDEAGGRLAGNLPVLLAAPGWTTIQQAGRRSFEADEFFEEREEHAVEALGRVLPDGEFLLVGYDSYLITEAQEAIIHAFSWAVVLAGMLALAGGAVVSFHFLKRIDEINRTTRAVLRGVLDDRVAVRGTADELDELAAGLNHMLDRIEALLEGLHQVSSDIAHDLRTPLSRLRQRLEAVQIRASSIEDYRSAVNQAIADTDAIIATFSALLRIAQIEASAGRSEFAPVDLSRLCRGVAEAYAAVAEDKGQTLNATLHPDVTIQGDRNLLTQMLANLVENAIRHSPAGSTLSVSLTSQAGRPLLMVADTGPGIPEAERERVFRRFYRLDSSRTTPGSGLGLTLVKAVADIHGATLALGDNAPGLRISIAFAAVQQS